MHSLKGLMADNKGALRSEHHQGGGACVHIPGIFGELQATRRAFCF